MSLQFHVCIDKGIQNTVPITEDLVQQWMDSEKAIICFTVERSSMLNTTIYCSYHQYLCCLVTFDWHSHYFYMLQSYYTTRYIFSLDMMVRISVIDIQGHSDQCSTRKHHNAA